jgi:hypothetical protein
VSDVFISYRREGGDALALFFRGEFMRRGYSVFLDVADLKRGYFDETLLTYIAEAPSFIVILSPHSLDRCNQEGDWLRREIAQAIKAERNIIPILMPGFEFPPDLPPDINLLPRHQAVPYSHVYFEAMIDKILTSIEADRAERREKAERDRVAREREEAETERAGPENAEQDRSARARVDAERKAAEQLVTDRKARDETEQERLDRQNWEDLA